MLYHPDHTELAIITPNPCSVRGTGLSYKCTVCQACSDTVCCLWQIPPEGRKLLVLGTTSVGAVMQEMDVSSAFNVVLHVPMLRESQIGAVMQSLQAFAPEDVRSPPAMRLPCPCISASH